MAQALRWVWQVDLQGPESTVSANSFFSAFPIASLESMRGHTEVGEFNLKFVSEKKFSQVLAHLLLEMFHRPLKPSSVGEIQHTVAEFQLSREKLFLKLFRFLKDLSD